jgi:hypothetical protein
VSSQALPIRQENVPLEEMGLLLTALSPLATLEQQRAIKPRMKPMIASASAVSKG